ncbi:MAG: DUF2442 domain-containing protein [Betaproteobacteria bacterium]|jgi:hypothetical protein
MIWVTDAKHLGDFRLRLRFSDGAEGEVDLGRLITTDTRPIVMALRDPAVFAAFSVDMDTVMWRNGFDLAPEYLYAQVKAAATA